jgi:hypothetical protein
VEISSRGMHLIFHLVQMVLNFREPLIQGAFQLLGIKPVSWGLALYRARLLEKFEVI